MTMPINPYADVVDAVYKAQSLPMFQGNILIEALPLPLDDDDLIGALWKLPDFTEEQRRWSIHERLQMISTLESFLVPLGRNLHLYRAIDSMIRYGYIGRAPRTADYIRVYQELYAASKQGRAFSVRASQLTPQLSAAFLGFPGMGKTTGLKRTLATYPQVIKHPAHNIIQVVYLHIGMPFDGASVRAIAHAILRAIDKLVPDGDYYETYAKPSAGAVPLINSVARILHMHCVGMVIVDESQNLLHAPVGDDKLMALLVSASNELGVPFLFTATEDIRELLGKRLSLGRRSVGYGFEAWRPLARSGRLESPGEWEEFLSVLWRYQWVKEAVGLTDDTSELVYHLCPGIPDLAIKLFACAQWRAILDGSEKITHELLLSVAKRELQTVMPWVDAVRNNVSMGHSYYDAVSDISFQALFGSALNRYEGVVNPMASVKPGEPNFKPAVSNALTSIGVSQVRAEAIADSVEREGRAGNVLDGAKEAIAKVMAPKKTSRKSVKQKPSDDNPTLCPGDYRNAAHIAAQTGTSILDALHSTNAFADLRVVLNL